MTCKRPIDILQMFPRPLHVRYNPFSRWKNYLVKLSSSKSFPYNLASTDPLGLPLKPSWSVHDLINSYPSPKLSEETIRRLHRLAALMPAKEGSPEFVNLKKEMEDLIRLVEAVKAAPTAPVDSTIEICDTHVEDSTNVNGLGWQMKEGPPDGRIWPRGQGMNIDEEVEIAREDMPSGVELLKEAKRTKDGFYTVDSMKKKS